MRIEATFITSGAGAADFPSDSRPEVALVGRSNVGKSCLINALVRRKVARTSGAPGKTRLANFYRVTRGGGPPLYFVDLPGYGFARGGDDAAHGFDELVRSFFDRDRRQEQDSRESKHLPASPNAPANVAALLLVDSRHPGLQNDIEAWRWLQTAADRLAVVATKIDKLSRAERQRAIRQLEAVLEHPVLPVSAVTGEGLDELWILIDRLANNPNNPNNPNNLNRPDRPNRQEQGPSSLNRLPRSTAARPPRR